MDHLVLPQLVSIGSDIDLLRIEPTRQTVSEMGVLFEKAKPDTSFQLEPTFQRTIDAYSTLTEQEIYERLEQKYAGVNPPMIGYLVLKDNVVSGMMTIGKVGVEWQTDAGDKGALADDEGINFNQWYIAEKRNTGIGTAVARWRLGLMRALVTEDINWRNRTPWTSIRHHNAPSISITSSLLAFDRVGEHASYMDSDENMRRDIWVANNRF